MSTEGDVLFGIPYGLLDVRRSRSGWDLYSAQAAHDRAYQSLLATAPYKRTGLRWYWFAPRSAFQPTHFR